MCSAVLICNVVLAFQQSMRSRSILASKVEITLPVIIEACSLNPPKRHFWRHVSDRDDLGISKSVRINFLDAQSLVVAKKPGLVGPRDGGEDVSLLIRDP